MVENKTRYTIIIVVVLLLFFAISEKKTQQSQISCTVECFEYGFTDTCSKPLMCDAISNCGFNTQGLYNGKCVENFQDLS